MADRQDIKKALKELTATDEEIYSIPCIVYSVDTINKTCYCLPVDEGKSDITSVRLIADNKTGVFIIPKINSIVIVNMISKVTGYVGMFSEVDEILLNGDFYGGIPQVQPLVDKINALENLVNDILNVLKTTSIPLAPSGTYPFAPLYAAFNDIIPITQKSDLENTTVKHGNGN